MNYRTDLFLAEAYVHLLSFPRLGTFYIDWFAFLFLMAWQWKHKFLTMSMLPDITLKGQCPDYSHARASSDFSSKDNRTVILTRQDFLPDRTGDGDLLFTFSSNIFDTTNNCFVVGDGAVRKEILSSQYDSSIVFWRGKKKVSKKLCALFKIWLAARRLIAILSLAGPPSDPKIPFYSL